MRKWILLSVIVSSLIVSGCIQQATDNKDYRTVYNQTGNYIMENIALKEAEMPRGFELVKSDFAGFDPSSPVFGNESLNRYITYGDLGYKGSLRRVYTVGEEVPDIAELNITYSVYGKDNISLRMEMQENVWEIIKKGVKDGVIKANLTRIHYGLGNNSLLYRYRKSDYVFDGSGNISYVKYSLSFFKDRYWVTMHYNVGLNSNRDDPELLADIARKIMDKIEAEKG